MKVATEAGDEVTLTEDIGEPKSLDDIDSEAAGAIQSCAGSSDRDLVVPVDLRVTLDSSLAATVEVNPGFVNVQGLIEYSDGSECTDSIIGNITYNEMEPGSSAKTRLWVILRGAKTPNDPTGENLQQSFSLNQPSISLPSGLLAQGTIVGPRVVRCEGIGAARISVWVAGPSPLRQSDGVNMTDCALQE